MKILAIFLKELVDLLRDRRSFFSGLLYALAGPALALFAVSIVAGQSREAISVSYSFCSGHQPQILVEHLAARGFTLEANAKICMIVADDFEARLGDGRAAPIDIQADLTVMGASVRRLESELQRFAGTLGAQRLLARGVSPSVTSPLSIDTHSTNAVSRQADAIARMLIIFFVCAPFFVSLAASADMTAGERERRSLEPLLAHPVSAFGIVVGKWLAVSVVSVFGVTLCVAAGLTLLEYSALAELGIRLETGIEAIIRASVMLVPLTLMIVALQLAVGLWSKSFKDAQSYLTLMSFAPVVAGFAVTGEKLAQAGYYPLAWELNALAVPLLNSTTPVAPFPILVGVELLVTAGLLALCAYRLRSEGVLSQA